MDPKGERRGRRKPLWFLLATTALALVDLSGCYWERVPESARTRAPDDLSCAADRIQWDVSKGRWERYRADGCGRWLEYQCVSEGKAGTRVCFPDARPIAHDIDAMQK